MNNVRVEEVFWRENGRFALWHRTSLPIQSWYRRTKHVTLIQQQGNRYSFRFDKREQTASDLIATLAQNYAVTDVSVEKPDIETVVREFYEQTM